MKIFNSISHFFAWLGLVALPAAEKDIAAVQAVVESPIATAIASLTGPKGQNVQAVINALGGQALAVLVSAGEAVAGQGINIVADEAVISSIATAIADIKAAFDGKKVPVSTPTELVSPAHRAPAPAAA